jgi:DNA-binding transcriptional ArsR family regulator
VDVAEIFKALGEPVRWDIVRQLGEVDELPCATLERTLSISKPTISYHVRQLHRAGLVSIRKSGRSQFCTLRRDALRAVLAEMGQLVFPAVAGARAEVEGTRGPDRASAPDDLGAMVPTW